MPARLLAQLGQGWRNRAAGQADHGEHADAAPQMLVAAPLADWSAVALLQRGQRQQFERDAQGQWLYHAAQAGEASAHRHHSNPAEAERIGSVLATLSRARIERTLPSDPARPAYGMDNPALIVLVQGADGRVLQTLEFGDLAADGLSRYVHLPQTHQLHTVPNYHLSGLMSLLAQPAGAPGNSAAAPGTSAAASAP